MDSTTVSEVSKKKSNMAMPMAGLVSVGALTAGMGDCAFDAAKADSCVANAQKLIGPFQKMGDGIIEWGTAILQAAF